MPHLREFGQSTAAHLRVSGCAGEGVEEVVGAGVTGQYEAAESWRSSSLHLAKRREYVDDDTIEILRFRQGVPAVFRAECQLAAQVLPVQEWDREDNSAARRIEDFAQLERCRRDEILRNFLGNGFAWIQQAMRIDEHFHFRFVPLPPWDRKRLYEREASEE
jgi:hypothetical protein